MERNNLLFLLLFLSLTLDVSTYPLILGNIETNGLITLSKYPTNYLELVFVSTNFEITILSTLTSQIYIGLFTPQFCYFYFAKSQHYCSIKKIYVIIFLAN